MNILRANVVKRVPGDSISPHPPDPPTPSTEANLTKAYIQFIGSHLQANYLLLAYGDSISPADVTESPVRAPPGPAGGPTMRGYREDVCRRMGPIGPSYHPIQLPDKSYSSELILYS